MKKIFEFLRNKSSTKSQGKKNWGTEILQNFFRFVCSTLSTQIKNQLTIWILHNTQPRNRDDLKQKVAKNKKKSDFIFH